jgi:hypothetical protein
MLPAVELVAAQRRSIRTTKPLLARLLHGGAWALTGSAAFPVMPSALAIACYRYRRCYLKRRRVPLAEQKTDQLDR